MCGSLLSKLKKASKQVDPAIDIFFEQKRVPSETKLARGDSACYEDRGFWKSEQRNDESSANLSATSSSESLGSSDSDSWPQNEIEAAVCVVERPVLPSTNNKKVRFPVVDSYINQEKVLLESAREILAFQGYRAASSSNTMAALPISSTNPTLPENVKTAVAFDITAGNEMTVSPSAGVPWRLRKRRKVAPEITLQAVGDKMRAAEERKLVELERIRECARSRAAGRRPHPVEASAQATKQRITVKQTAEEINEETGKRKEAVNRTLRSRKRIEAARAYAKTQFESSIERTAENERGQVKQQQKTEEREKLQEKNDKKDIDKVSSEFFFKDIIDVNLMSYRREGKRAVFFSFRAKLTGNSVVRRGLLNKILIRHKCTKTFGENQRRMKQGIFLLTAKWSRL